MKEIQEKTIEDLKAAVEAQAEAVSKAGELLKEEKVLLQETQSLYERRLCGQLEGKCYRRRSVTENEVNEEWYRLIEAKPGGTHLSCLRVERTAKTNSEVFEALSVMTECGFAPQAAERYEEVSRDEFDKMFSEVVTDLGSLNI